MARQREKLLELIRRLAEDDKDGVMADKVREKSVLIFDKVLSNLVTLTTLCLKAKFITCANKVKD